MKQKVNQMRANVEASEFRFRERLENRNGSLQDNGERMAAECGNIRAGVIMLDFPVSVAQRGA